MSPDYEKVEERREEKIGDIREMTNKLTQIVTHPEFLNAIQKIEDPLMVERTEYVSIYMRPTALAEKGIPLPEGFRITNKLIR